jgi:hypothetical protein
MHHRVIKWIIVVVIGIAGMATIAYLVVFGRALSQQENHVGIVLALPKAVFSEGVVSIDEKTGLAKNSASFIEEMEGQGFIYVEQLGSGYFFHKDGNRYFSSSRMYSSHFMVFTYPVIQSR